ncbi:microcystin-dependent protein [Bradyrhizobium niftali]|uniref:phage tail protein n=1 Tax=Bradyrhizobium niftali TaxID=2560055 RepID=UPI0038338E36
MPSGFYTWSETAAANGTADASVSWPEGMAPSAINDSARAMMAILRRWGSDISGAIATTGTSTAYAVTSHSTYDSLAHLDGQVIAFTPHTTCGATVTLNVDSLGAKPLRSAPSVELPAGVIIQGTPYLATYNNSQGAFYLQNFFGNPYGIPIGASVDFWGTTAPNSSFVLAYGQAISRTTYATLFSMFSTTYGAGDGTTTFNVPDCRGRVIAGKDDMGGSSASRLTSSYFGGTATSLGAIGGGESLALTAAQLPSLSISGTTSGTMSVSGTGSNGFTGGNVGSGVGGGGAFGGNTTVSVSGTASGTLSVAGSVSGTGGQAHRTVQPTIIANKLIRII